MDTRDAPKVARLDDVLLRCPVTSLTFSSMVTPSMMSPYFTVPATSVRIGMAYGSHSAVLGALLDRLTVLHLQEGAVREVVRLLLAPDSSTILSTPWRFMTTVWPSAS
jgi:hypothetical protein